MIKEEKEQKNVEMRQRYWRSRKHSDTDVKDEGRGISHVQITGSLTRPWELAGGKKGQIEREDCGE